MDRLFTFDEVVELYARALREGRSGKLQVIGIGSRETVVSIADYVTRRARISAEALASTPEPVLGRLIAFKDLINYRGEPDPEPDLIPAQRSMESQ